MITHAKGATDQTVDPDEIVGHKTFGDGRGGFRHEPLTRAEGDRIMAAVDAAIADRAARLPTAEDAVRAMFDAWQRLTELGWKDSRYAPPDGDLKRTVSVGSSGIHEAYCEPRPDGRAASEKKWWWHPSEGDLWPHSPILYLPTDAENAEREARWAKARETLGT